MLLLYFWITKFFKKIIFAVSVGFFTCFVMLGINEVKNINFTTQMQNVLESEDKTNALQMLVLQSDYNSSPNFFEYMRILDEMALSRKLGLLSTSSEQLKFMLEHSMCAMHPTEYPHSVKNVVIIPDLNDVLSRLFFVLKKPKSISSM
jgi:hypothetical protein